MNGRLRAEVVVRITQHARDCARDCGGSFVCTSCDRRFGACLCARATAARKLCLRCDAKHSISGRS